jgi:hypothetical protein
VMHRLREALNAVRDTMAAVRAVVEAV